MNKHSIAAAALAAAVTLSGSAWALGATTTNVQVNATAGSFCTLSGGTSVTISGLQLAIGTVNPNSFNNAPAVNLTGACNSPGATAAVVANPLTDGVSTAAPAGFTHTIPYTSSAVFGTTTVNSTSATPTAIGLFSGTVPVSFKSIPGVTNVGVAIAGTYTGSVVVTLTPGS